MDLHILHKASKKKEKMADLGEVQGLTEASGTQPFSPSQFNLNIFDSSENEGISVLMLLIKLFIAVVAAYLSWGCSGMYSTPIRVLFAFLAAIFGSFYILMYIIFRSDLCK